MRTFRFYPPSPEEQRSFVMLLFGSALTVVVAGFLAWRTDDAGLRGAMIGLALGVLFLLARTAVQLELKAQRAQNAEIAVGERGLQITDSKGLQHPLTWDAIEKTEVRGGRLHLQWRGGKLDFGSREVEDGMELIQLIAARGKSTIEPNSKTNFIPLSPK